MLFTSVMFKCLLLALMPILLDTLFGILVSIKNRTFSVSKMPQFLVTNVFPYIAALVTLALLSAYLSELEYLYYVAVGMVALKFSKEALLDKMKQLFM